jgi:predicted ATPase
MYISRFQVGNYKSFHEPAALEFTPGFNIISGQNNAGKTALLEALALNFGGKPHRSTRTVPARDTIPDQVSWADVSFTLPPNELIEFMLASGNAVFSLAKPDLGSPFARKIAYVDDSKESAQKLWRGILREAFLTINLHLEAGQRNGWSVPGLPSYGLYPAQAQPGMYHYVHFMIAAKGEMTNIGGSSRTQIGDVGLELVPAFRRHIYRFNAERMNVGQGPHGPAVQLAQNAANLPEVLAQLQHNPSAFAALNRTLNDILPQVRQVSVRGVGPGQLEIVVWPHDPETRREDLAVPLLESGTGISQVLAILYVVMTSDRPQVMIIDEPQSFLHPGAARKLIEFLRMDGRHQFIIATHSPTIIAAADPKTITLVRYKDGESTLQQLDTKLEKGIQATLAEVGVRLSDSFGADNILWVEGRTEEECFRLVVEKLLRRPLGGTEILGIRQTGDLESKDARKILEIYRGLAEGASLLPPAVAFILDQECRNEVAKRELVSLSDGRVRFLPRRMYENYLLNCEAIAAIVNDIPDFSPTRITSEVIGAAIDAKLASRGFHCTGAASFTMNTVDGARVLAEIFNEFSETRVRYEKVRHGLALTEWLIDHRPEELEEVSILLEEVLEGVVTAEEASPHGEIERPATA